MKQTSLILEVVYYVKQKERNVQKFLISQSFKYLNICQQKFHNIFELCCQTERKNFHTLKVRNEMTGRDVYRSFQKVREPHTCSIGFNLEKKRINPEQEYRCLQAIGS